MKEIVARFGAIGLLLKRSSVGQWSLLRHCYVGGALF